MSEIARPDHSRIIQDKHYQSSQRLSFTGTQGKFRLFSAYLTIKESTWSWLRWHKPLIPAVEMQRLTELCLQGQPGLQRVWGQPGLHSETSSQRTSDNKETMCMSLATKLNTTTASHSCWVGSSKLKASTRLFSLCTRSLLCSRQISQKWMDRLEGT